MFSHHINKRLGYYLSVLFLSVVLMYRFSYQVFDNNQQHNTLSQTPVSPAATVCRSVLCSMHSLCGAERNNNTLRYTLDSGSYTYTKLERRKRSLALRCTLALGCTPLPPPKAGHTKPTTVLGRCLLALGGVGGECRSSADNLAQLLTCSAFGRYCILRRARPPEPI